LSVDGVAEVAQVALFPRKSLYEDTIRNFPGIPATSATSATQEDLSGMELKSMLTDYTKLSIEEMIDLWEKGGRVEVFIDEVKTIKDLGIYLSGDSIRIEHLGQISEVINKLKGGEYADTTPGVP